MHCPTTLFFLCLLLLCPLGFGNSTLAASPADSRLKNAIEPLLRNHRGEVALAIRSLSDEVHYEYHADVAMPTASLIKLPVMITAYRRIDEGAVDPDALIRLDQGDKVPGSGVLADHFSSGIQLPLRDYLRLMIRYSDNTATNIVAEQIGLRATAEMMESLGFAETKLHSQVGRGDTTVFPERSQQFGLGSTTAGEMVRLLVRLEQGQLASPASTTAMRQHLLACEDTSKLAARLPTTVKFAHKSGTIANCRTDAGILYTAAGPVAVCFLSNKNHDQSWSAENEAQLLAAKIGAVVADRFGSASDDAQLQEGAFGSLVETLQRTLNERLSPSPSLAIDGDYGPATRAAVARFQREKNLPESGVVTQVTWEALGTLIQHDAPVPPPAEVNSQTLPRQPQLATSDPPVVTCKAWVIADHAGQVLFQHNANSPLEAASTTKIMTAYLVLRDAQSHPQVLAETVRFSERADNTVGSTAGVRAGESLSVKQLLYGLLLPSGNDASVALAEHFGHRLAGEPAADERGTGETNHDASYQQFVAAMNAAAAELKLTHAHYVNPHGLSDATHVISAADLAALSHAACQFPLFQEICGTRQFGCTLQSEQGYRRNVVWKNTNELLEIEGYTGVKTGTTSAAGACLVARGRRADDTLMVVVLGSSSSPARYADARNLFRWAWQQRARNR